MENLLDIAVLSAYVEQYLTDWLTMPFSFGLFLGGVLEILGYGIFKAVNLINIK